MKIIKIISLIALLLFSSFFVVESGFTAFANCKLVGDGIGSKDLSEIQNML